MEQFRITAVAEICCHFTCKKRGVYSEMFRKPTKKRAPVQVRQRQDDDISDEDEADIVKDVKRRKRANPFQQSTLKTKADENKASSSSDSDDGANAIVAEDAFAASGSAAPLGPRDQGMFRLSFICFLVWNHLSKIFMLVLSVFLFVF
ncbi:hypothetical protein OESDEN_21020 [Oesophagostomum dentatum]|uniref:Uncharacterized protein n=1 Tax=Oesophagostomum dentatum TaxID=61180 RepID=A0A0B1S7Y3_OESDE|nr:hypothetical protein OESDEN_21020 [Oesophagostomum dentatum]